MCIARNFDHFLIHTFYALRSFSADILIKSFILLYVLLIDISYFHILISFVKFNPLSARAFFWAFFEKISKIWYCNAISQEWINQNTKFCMPFCSNFYSLSTNSGTFFIIFTVSGVTAVRSDHGVISYIPDIGT